LAFFYFNLCPNNNSNTIGTPNKRIVVVLVVNIVGYTININA